MGKRSKRLAATAQPPYQYTPTADPNWVIRCGLDPTSGEYNVDCQRFPASQVPMGVALARRPLRAAQRRALVADPITRLSVRKASAHGGYGWVHDLPDARDFIYAAPLIRFPQGLPPSIDLRSECPPVYNQGQLGSCTANGIAGAIEFDQRKQGKKEFTPSRLFIYYNERVIEGTVDHDAGAQIRDGIKAVAKLGAPPETDWPYDIAKFAQRPPPLAYSDAKQDLVSSYSRVVQDATQMRGCLAEGYPF